MAEKTNSITGIITEEPIIKSGMSGGRTWKRCSYTVNKMVFSTFDINLMDFKKGEEVTIEFDVSDDGKYNNISNMMLLTPAPETSKETKKIEIKKGKIKITINIEEQ